jgi:hypothetical protein
MYLRLAFEEARLWHSYTEVDAARLREGIGELIRSNLFGRLQEPRHHGRTLVAHALGYLAASRYGLTEDELIELLSSDDEVKADFHARSPKSPPVASLPVVVWSRLYFDLEPYLSEHASEGVTLLAFYHRQLQEAAALEFLDGEDRTARHRGLAAYFRRKADPAADGAWSGGSVRGLSELPFYLVKTGTPEALDELCETITDYVFMQRKLSDVGVVERTSPVGKSVRDYGGVLLLRDDYRMALEYLSGDTATVERPLVVTAVDFGKGLAVACPWCSSRSPLQDAWRGAVIECPGCGRPLRVNQFVAEKT